MKYGIHTRSESEWYPKTSKASLFNHESSTLNILNLGVKGTGITKEMAMQEDKQSCINKKKSITEFTDVFRYCAPNPNVNYRKTLQANPNEFKHSSNLCANYGNLFNTYKSLSEHPFSKKKYAL